MITFGPFVLIPSQQLLLKTDQMVPIGSRAFDILTCLVERPGEIVSKEDLIARVWPDVFGQEGNLKVHVATLRQVLGDGQGGNRYIVNVPGRGYRFVAEVSHRTAPSRTDLSAVAATGSHNLPAPLTRILGRAELIRAIANQISERRFVSIVALTISTVPLWLNLSLMDECRHRVKRARSCLSCAAIKTPRQEMQLFTALGVALYSIGPGRESKAAWTQVIQIAKRLKDTDYELRAQWGLWTVCVTGGKHRDGLALAQQFVSLAGKARDPEGQLVGERLLGISRHFLGEQTSARRHLEGMLNRAPLGNPADILRFQFDQSVVARARS